MRYLFDVAIHDRQRDEIQMETIELAGVPTMRERELKAVAAQIYEAFYREVDSNNYFDDALGDDILYLEDVTWRESK